MNTLSDDYVQGLLNSYNDRNKEYFKLIKPVSDEKINVLCSLYPSIPNELISLLKIVNGSNYLDFFQLYPGCDDATRYRFCTIEEMIAYEKEGDYSWLNLCWNENSSWEKEDVVREMFGDEVKPDALVRERILLAENCYSQLYIDFNPSKCGTEGQMVVYIHDPDSYFQVAVSFSEYLKNHIDNDFEDFECN